MSKAKAMSFLKDLMTKINTQDNRCTASPYHFCIESDYSEFVYPENETTHLRDNEGRFFDANGCREIIYSDSDLKKLCVVLHEASNPDHVSDGDIFDFLEEYGEDFEPKEKVTYQKYHEHFFTLEACEEHLRVNRHNYTNPRTYVKHDYRNIEMENLLSALGEITGLGRSVAK